MEGPNFDLEGYAYFLYTVAKQPQGGTCVRSARFENSNSKIVLALSTRGDVTLWMYAA